MPLEKIPASAHARPPKVYRVAVVGTGYVGTVVAACFAHLGYEVTGIETDTAKLIQLQVGQIPFHEPGLEDLVNSCLRAGRLRFTADYADGMAGADAVFVCVGTPPLPDGTADMSALNDAVRSVAAAVRHPVTVVTKSTIPLGAAQSVCTVLQDMLVQRNGQAAPVTLVHNPEFLREGSAIGDFLRPDRVVLGSEDAQAVRLVADLYRPILQQSFNGADPTKRPGLLCTDLTTAEAVKYASNAFLATKISFINELANICDLVGADVTSVATGMGLDHRIGAEFLSAGLGWGGSCFGKDLSSLITTARREGYEPALLTATVEVNKQQHDVLVDKLIRHLDCLAGRRIGLLGLAFKPGTDDLRDSPALEVAERLLHRGAEVIAYDPLVSGVSHVPGLTVVGDPYDVATDADAVVLATDWPDFLLLDLAKLRVRMRGNVFLDGRNVFDHYMMDAAGLSYEPVGRPKAGGAIELDWVPEIRQHPAPANSRHLDARAWPRPPAKTRALVGRSDVDGT
jgi:UDPglucose 6-dehydrogenase